MEANSRRNSERRNKENNDVGNGKQRITGTASEGIDYISNLPDMLLLHILSFLPLKEWIMVSLLSKRWKYLWTNISILNLNEIEIISNIMKKGVICSLCGDIPCQNSSYRCLHNLRYTARRKFMELVDRMLLLHSGSVIENMNLSFFYDHRDGYNHRINTWIHFALTSNIKELKLNFSDAEHFKLFDEKGLTVRRPNPPKPYEIPSGAFAPKILRTFTLTFCTIRISNFSALTSLRKFHFKQLKILDGSMKGIAFKCPVLEDVFLEYCLLPEGFLVSDEDIMIKRLSVVHCESNERLSINLSTPNLIMLRIVGESLHSASIQKATHLVEAQIGICLISTNNGHGDALNSLLGNLNHCQCLTLSTWSIQVMPLEPPLPQQLPILLQNVKNLKLTAGISKKELPRLSCLLRSCPNLEVLNLVLSGPLDLLGFELPNPTTDDIDEETYWESQVQPFICLENSLKEIRVTGLMGRTNEVQLIMFLLKKAVVLEKVQLLLSGLNKYLYCSPDEFEVFQRNLNQIYDFIRTSTHAQASVSVEPYRGIHQYP